VHDPTDLGSAFAPGRLRDQDLDLAVRPHETTGESTR
jgi:hypothetical protein